MTFDPCHECSAPTAKGTLASPDILEASGLAASAVHPGIFYLHNDSGDTPRFFAIDLSGEERARYLVDGAFAVDWEDMASGPCKAGRCLYFGDVGDNEEQRTSYTVYRVEEPSAIEPGEHHVASEPLVFSYPDGSHNCETVLVHPQTGELFLVTKRLFGPSGVYRLPMPHTPGRQAVLEKVGTVAPPAQNLLITGGAIHPEGKGVLIRTYTSLFYYAMKGDLALALASAPCSLQVASEKQGEAVAWSPEGDGFVTVSEGSGAALNYSDCR
jgi:hypothetical protein